MLLSIVSIYKVNMIMNNKIKKNTELITITLQVKKSISDNFKKD